MVLGRKRAKVRPSRLLGCFFPGPRLVVQVWRLAGPPPPIHRSSTCRQDPEFKGCYHWWASPHPGNQPLPVNSTHVASTGGRGTGSQLCLLPHPLSPAHHQPFQNPKSFMDDLGEGARQLVVQDALLKQPGVPGHREVSRRAAPPPLARPSGFAHRLGLLKTWAGDEGAVGRGSSPSMF